MLPNAVHQHTGISVSLSRYRITVYIPYRDTNEAVKHGRDTAPGPEYGTPGYWNREYGPGVPYGPLLTPGFRIPHPIPIPCAAAVSRSCNTVL